MKLKEKKKKKIIKEELKKKKKREEEVVKKTLTDKFWYLSDLYSRMYDVWATKLETRRYLKPGRLFSGVGIRKMVKRKGMRVI